MNMSGMQMIAGNRVAGYAIALCTALGVLAGCGGSDVVKPSPLVEFKPTANAKVMWKNSVGDSDVYIFTPAVEAGSVYAASAKGTLARFDATSGKQIWRTDTKEPLSGGVGVDGDLAVVATRRGAVVAYTLAGKLAWKSQVSSEVLMSPRIAQGVVIVRSGDGKIYALDAKNGASVWEYRFSLPPLLLRSDSGVILSRGMVLAGLPAGKLVALNLTNGTVLWESTLAQPKGANELERITDIAAAPAIDGDQGCAVAYQGRVGCYDVTRGSLIWSREASSAVALAIDPITLYMADTKGSVSALDKNTGATIWKQDKLTARQVSAPLQISLYVTVGDYKGYVHFLDRDDGGFAVRLATDGSAIKSRPVRGAGQTVVVQTRKGSVYAITPSAL
ncbi:MAG: outer membrane protein assembly factor BamB [Betaproteobacteria bacterium]